MTRWYETEIERGDKVVPVHVQYTAHYQRSTFDDPGCNELVIEGVLAGGWLVDITKEEEALLEEEIADYLAWGGDEPDYDEDDR